MASFRNETRFGGNLTHLGVNETRISGNEANSTDETRLEVGTRTGFEIGEWNLGVAEADVGEEEAWVLWLSYGVVVPVVVTAGLLLNGTGLYLLTRPAMKARPGNAYLVVLVVCDVLTLGTSIPTALTLNGCHLTSYNTALYFAHTFYTAFYVLQTYTLYIILWISYDRFLALWAWERFHKAQGRGTLWLRLSLTLLLCVGVHVRHLVDVQVVCWRWVRDSWKPDVAASVIGDSCERGVWVLQDGLHQGGREKMWAEELWWVVRGLVVLAIPISLVLIFNMGIIVGMVTRRLHNTAATATTRRHALSSIYITLGVSGTFLICTLPILLHAVFFAANIQHCHGPHAEEVFRGVANILLLLEHLTHVPLLAFNLTFRAEAKKLLGSLQVLAQKTVIRVQQALPLSCPCSCRIPCPLPCTLIQEQKEGEASKHPAAEEIKSPPQLTISPPEITDRETGTQENGGQGGDTAAVAVGGSKEREQENSYHIPLNFVCVPGDDGGSQDKSSSRNNRKNVSVGERQGSSNHLQHHLYLSPTVNSDPPSRSSTVTVIEEDV